MGETPKPLDVLLEADQNRDFQEVKPKYCDQDAHRTHLVVPCPHEVFQHTQYNSLCINEDKTPSYEREVKGTSTNDSYEGSSSGLPSVSQFTSSAKLCEPESELSSEDVHRANRIDAQAQGINLPTQGKLPFDICLSSSDASVSPKNAEDLAFESYATDEELAFESHATADNSRILRHGMVLLKNFISFDEQVKIVGLCRGIGLGEGGFYQPTFVNGGKLHLQLMCLGLDWDPETHEYGDIRKFDGTRVPPVPESFSSICESAIAAAHELINADLSEGSAVDILPHMHPNICIVNYYKTNGRLGLHQDKDESQESIEKGLPVISISLGDSAFFAYGDKRSVKKADEVILESGDVLIFGGSSRLIYHGVVSIIPDSAPAAFRQATNLLPGRLNLTFREF